MSVTQELKTQISKLQQRLGCHIQATIYNSSLNSGDNLLDTAKSCRMSIVQQNASGWKPGNEATPIYAVRIVAEGVGEIPYALMAEELYEEGKNQQNKPVFSDQMLATSALASVVSSMFNNDELEQLILSAHRSEKLNNEQLVLLKQYFLEGEV